MFTFELICSKKCSKTVLQHYHGPPKPARDAWDDKPVQKHNTNTPLTPQRLWIINILPADSSLNGFTLDKKTKSGRTDLLKEFKVDYCHFKTPQSATFDKRLFNFLFVCLHTHNSQLFAYSCMVGVQREAASCSISFRNPIFLPKTIWWKKWWQIKGLVSNILMNCWKTLKIIDWFKVAKYVFEVSPLRPYWPDDIN